MLSSARTVVRTIGLLAALVCPGLARANPDVIEDHNTWAQFVITGPLLAHRPGAQQWRYGFDSQLSYANDSSQYAQGVWRGGLGYALNAAWTVGAGYGYTRTNPPYTRASYTEHRGFQQLAWAGRAGDYTLNYRFRFEERFPNPGDEMGLRMRHQFRVSHPIRAIKPLSWVLGDEIFWNLNATDYGARPGFDQNRAFAGFGWQWSETTRSEAGYLHQFARRPGQADRVNHILALSLALSFK